MSMISRRDKGADVTSFTRMDRLFDEWFRALPMRRPFGLDWPAGEELIRVDEYRDGDTQVIKADLPGIDPAKDVEITAADGMLRIRAERRIEQDREDKGYTRHEIRYGSMMRTLPLPENVSEGDITASYKDGMLEIRIPMPPVPEAKKPTSIPVSSS
ncbi:Hsp20/alpha crystallin family protein [Pseudonocardia sp. RS11V-5]|uniref:Hsp20/alpha crystallin family protein n=1 Tax=Pseudonocardia terrae TaxID=2905831 RepID=UPI001E33FD0D|nr:Hsp20/alpha crystallin family protein [Pseudonocardia terrae]MCE3553141.1 Hsp20/alpha crystallin family protein [Pseudonocardia terrae]